MRKSGLILWQGELLLLVYEYITYIYVPFLSHIEWVVVAHIMM